MKVRQLEFIQIWHKRYDGDPGHGWLRNLVLDAVKPAWTRRSGLAGAGIARALRERGIRRATTLYALGQQNSRRTKQRRECRTE